MMDETRRQRGQGWLATRNPGSGGRPRVRALAPWVVVALVTFASVGGGPTALGQIPGLPGVSKAAPAPAPKNDPSRQPVPAKGKPGEVFSATSGPIEINQVVNDAAIEKVLNELLVQYPGVRSAHAQARDGMVTLDGQVDDDDTMDDVTTFAQKVEGVRLVLNKMRTDAEVLTGPQKAANVLRHYRHIVAENWLLAIVAVGFAIGFATLARLFNEYAETILAPFFRNSLLRSVVGSVISSLLFVAGIMIGLSVLNLTHAVLSILGLAGVAGLALGFAFRDIAENFIASMLLGIRRPFGIGDFITVAGRSGSVLSLDTRATSLITPEGIRVQIPNAVIYKEILANASITPSTLGATELVVPYDISTADAIAAMDDTLKTTGGLLAEPGPRTLVLALEPTGVRLKASYWMPSKGLDLDRLQSDLRLRIKVRLQQIALDQRQPAPSQAPTPDLDNAPTPTAAQPADPSAQGPATVGMAATAANLRKDTEAAAQAATNHTDHEATPVDHAIRQAEAAAANNGGNLLANGKV